MGGQLSWVYLCLLSTGFPVGLILATPQSVTAQTMPAAVQRGYTQLSQGLVDQAIATFKQALNQYPDSIDAKVGLAVAYARAGRDQDAWDAYQRVLAQDDRNRLALEAIGKLGGFRPEWQVKGIQALTALVAIEPDNQNARAQRALLYGYQGQFAEAISDYDILLRANVVKPEILLGAAQAYTYSGNEAQGLVLFERYRSTGRTIDKDAVMAYARALRETGNVPQAITLLEAALPNTLSDYAIQVRGELAQAYVAAGQSALALGILDPLRGRNDARLVLARAYNEIGQAERRPDLRNEAARLYLEALQDPAEATKPSLRREVADVLSGITEQQPIALNLYRQLIQQDPNNRLLAIRLLALESRLGAVPAVQVPARLQALLQPFPTEPAELQSLAQALVSFEPTADLFPVYQALLQVGVNEPFLNFRIAQLLVEQGDLAGAQATIARYKATPEGVKDFAPDVLLADIDRRANNYEGAAQRYQGILTIPNLDPDVAFAALRGLAGVRVAQNRGVEALAIYDQMLQRNPADWQLRLGRTAVAYQAKLITEAMADAVLVEFLQFNPGETPQEFYTLVTLLPPSPQREPLYTALLQADPNNIDLQVRLIQVLSKRNPLQAQALANRLLVQTQQMAAINPNASVQTLFIRGRLAVALGNLEQAGDAYRVILGWQPTNLEAIAALGGIRFQQRQFDAASQLYSYVLAFQPDNAAAQQSLAELAAVQGRKLEALERFGFIRGQQGTAGLADVGVNQRIQQLQEDFLQQRGFQPSWERY
jgi:cellulose synthase operon protein C